MARRILIYSATIGYRHDSIPTAIDALRKHEAQIDVHFDATEDDTVFRDNSLSKYHAVLFLSNMGDVVSDNGMAGLQRYFDKGGNFIGIHSASCAMTNSDFFVKQVGATFDYHPDFCHATINVLDRTHPSTKNLPEQWAVEDEIYNFKSDPRKLGAVVILSVDENSYQDPGPRKYDHGSPHPIADMAVQLGIKSERQECPRRALQEDRFTLLWGILMRPGMYEGFLQAWCQNQWIN